MPPLTFSHKSHNIRINPEFIYDFRYRICTKCTLGISKKTRGDE